MAERGEAVELQAVRDGSAVYSVDAEIAATEKVPPGYKRTEVGVIPEDWGCVEMSQLLADISMGPFGSDIKVSNFVPEGVPVLDGYNVRKEKLVDSFSKFVTETKAKSLKKAVARRGDVVITHRGTIGQVSYIPFDSEFNEYVISQSQFRARFNASVLPWWVTNYFLSESGSGKLLEGKGHTGVPAIAQPTSTFRRLKLPLPSLDEQRAIAAALSDADALIVSLDSTIAKKRAIKQAAMQQLLTGQTRLPGFTGEWETKRLGDVGTFYKGQGIRRDDVSDEGVPCIRYGEIYTRYGDCVLTPESRIPEAVAEAALPLRTGDILFAGSGETAEEIGMCVAYLGEQSAFAGGDIVVLRPNEGVSAYLGRLLNHSTIAQQKTRLGQGDAVVHISARNLAQIEVHLPQREEQSAIATVLSDLDTEVEALERRRDKARQIKRGMMQQLLTGRVRLVEATGPCAGTNIEG